jgi:CheY-like chemotaxis protein
MVEKTKRFKDLSVLIAEDEELNRKYFAVIFKDTFKNLYYAKNGQEAIDICLNNPEIDVILMDMKMPEISGYTATKEIRKFDKEIIIISQTAYGLVGDKEKSLEAGCNDYISKPINKSEIFEIIGHYFKE